MRIASTAAAATDAFFAVRIALFAALFFLPIVVLFLPVVNLGIGIVIVICPIATSINAPAPPRCCCDMHVHVSCGLTALCPTVQTSASQSRIVIVELADVFIAVLLQDR
jgi:hypothetical protein